MNRDWQYSPTEGDVPNPTAVAHGPQMYDNHLYFNFGGLANQNEDSYMRKICNLTGTGHDVDSEAAIGDTPLFTGAIIFSLGTFKLGAHCLAGSLS